MSGVTTGAVKYITVWDTIWMQNPRPEDERHVRRYILGETLRDGAHKLTTPRCSLEPAYEEDAATD